MSNVAIKYIPDCYPHEYHEAHDAFHAEVFGQQDILLAHDENGYLTIYSVYEGERIDLELILDEVKKTLISGLKKDRQFCARPENSINELLTIQTQKRLFEQPCDDLKNEISNLELRDIKPQKLKNWLDISALEMSDGR